MLYSILVVGLFEKPPPLMRRWKGFVAADFIRHAHSDHFPQVGKMIGRVD
jgi:hypothetical protein